MKSYKKRKNLGRRIVEAGNIFMMLFGAVGMVGVIGASTMTVMKGPVRTMSVVTKRTIAENNMIAAGKLALIASASSPSSDCDSDGTIEPIAFDTSVTTLSGGGGIPTSIGVATEDPWGTKYGYCTWDHGSTIDDAACGSGVGYAQGDAGATGYVLAIVSAGPDGTFQTSCNDAPSTLLDKPSNSDDLLLGYTYAEANTSSAGLWNLQTPTVAEIQKDLEVRNSAGTQAFGVVDDAGTPAIQVDYIQGLNNATIDIMNPITADNISGVDLAASGTLGVTGISTLGVLNAGATTTTSLNATLAVDFDTTLNVDGTATINDLDVTTDVDVTGDTDVTTLGATGAVDFDSTLNVDGNVTVATDALVITAATDAVTMAGTATINDLDVTTNLDVTGNLTVGGTFVPTNLSVTDDTILGSDNADSITFNARAANDLDMNNNEIFGLPSVPSGDSYAASKEYVDNRITATTGSSETDPQVGTITTAGKLCTTDGTQINCTSDEADPQVGTLTSGRWCTTNGSVIDCTATAPGGGASAINDLTDAATDSTSVFLGSGAGAVDDGANGNTAVGIDALNDNTDGIDNTAIGANVLAVNVSGGGNTGVGASALFTSSAGEHNTAIGAQSLYSNVGGDFNLAAGSGALTDNTSGAYNTANGYYSLYANDDGGLNTAIGAEAGHYISGGAVDNTTGDYNVFIGAYTKPLADNDQNEIVIGYDATGAGSNTATIGNSAITRTVINGDIWTQQICDETGANCKDISTGWGGSVSALNDLSDVDTTGAVSGKVLKHNGTSWVIGDDNVGGGGVTFTGLTDTPANFTGAANQILQVNSGGTAVEFDTLALSDLPSIAFNNLSDVNTAGASNGKVIKHNGTSWVIGDDNDTNTTTLTGLTDTPANFTGAANRFLQVNSGATAVQFNTIDLDDLSNVNTTGAVSGKVLKHNGTSWVIGDDNTGGGGVTFTGLTDTPANFTGAANRFLQVNSGATAVQFSTIGLNSLSDVNTSGASNGKVIKHNGTSWVIGDDNDTNTTTFTGLTDTPSNYSGAARKLVAANSGGTAVEFVNVYYNGGRLGIGTNPASGVELDVVGDIEYTGTLTDVSDRRLKDNITPLSNNSSLLDKVNKIDTYSFTMKDDAEKRLEFGVMAQEMEKIFPELVHTADDEMQTKSVNYIGLIAPIIEATKELKAENEALRAELATLKRHNEEILKAVDSIGAKVGYITGDNKPTIASLSYIALLLVVLLSGAFLIFVIKRKK